MMHLEVSSLVKMQLTFRGLSTGKSKKKKKEGKKVKKNKKNFFIFFFLFFV